MSRLSGFVPIAGTYPAAFGHNTSMSRWSIYVFLLLTLLLPIRGGLAAAMSLSHGAPHAAHTTPVATEPCPHHEGTDSSTHASHDASHDSAQQHLLCDLCNGTALAVSAPRSTPAGLNPVTRVSELHGFLSASLPSETEPPII